MKTLCLFFLCAAAALADETYLAQNEIATEQGMVRPVLTLSGSGDATVSFQTPINQGRVQVFLNRDGKEIHPAVERYSDGTAIKLWPGDFTARKLVVTAFAGRRMLKAEFDLAAFYDREVFAGRAPAPNARRDPMKPEKVSSLGQ